MFPVELTVHLVIFVSLATTRKISKIYDWHCPSLETKKQTVYYTVRKDAESCPCSLLDNKFSETFLILKKPFFMS